LNLYVRLMIDSTVDGAYLLSTTVWILMVNKWMLPLVGLHWMAQLRRMATFYSRAPSPPHEELPTKVSPAPKQARPQANTWVDRPPVRRPVGRDRGRFFSKKMSRGPLSVAERLQKASEAVNTVGSV
jgi:hypothetical protein